MSFAEREFELIKIQDDGLPLRDHLMNLWRQTKEQPELLATQPPLPSGAEHVWGWFCEAHACRNSPNSRITGQALQAIEWMLGVEMELWERTAIRHLDALYLKVYND